MTPDDARRIALSQPNALEGFHHGHPDFRVGKSIFATLWPDKGTSVVRLPEMLADAVEKENPEAYKIVSRSRGAGWLSVQLMMADEDEFRKLMVAAHEFLTLK
jgi:hypothetical protein